MPELSALRSTVLLPASPLVQLLPPAARYILRGAAARAGARHALGFEVPAEPCRACVSEGRAALWLGPDEWLLLCPSEGEPQFAAALREALATVAHALVDVSHRQVGLSVRGAQAETLLESGCPLDLDAGAFPLGMCTRTMLAKSEIVLWRSGTQEFRLEVWRSFAPYVAAFLSEAARGII